MEDDLKKIKKWKQPKKKNGKRPKQKWNTNQSTKINLIGCDTIVNSPSFICWGRIHMLRTATSFTTTTTFLPLIIVHGGYQCNGWSWTFFIASSIDLCSKGPLQLSSARYQGIQKCPDVIHVSVLLSYTNVVVLNPISHGV